MTDNVKRLQRHKLHYCLVPSDDEQASFWVAAEDVAELEAERDAFHEAVDILAGCYPSSDGYAEWVVLEVQELRQGYANLEAENAELSRWRDNAVATCCSLRDRNLCEAEEEIESLKADNAALEERLAELEANHANLKHVHDLAEQEVAVLRSQNARLVALLRGLAPDEDGHPCIVGGGCYLCEIAALLAEIDGGGA